MTGSDPLVYCFAAEGGNADAMHDLSWHYDHGEGVEQDMKKDLLGTERAAEQDHRRRHEQPKRMLI